MATDKLTKAQEGKAFTSASKQPWQEFFDRSQTVPSSAIEAAEIISGMSGSWAAFFVSDTTVTQGGNLSPLVSPQVKSWKVGHAGLPEINFVPYDWGTNRFGNKGPSLLGHPISLSVVGPTLKSPACDWQWNVTDNSAGANGDVLAIDATHSMRSTAAVPGAAPNSTTIADAYSIGAVSNFVGGLYMVITQTGFEAEVAGAAGTGMGDGYVFDSSVNKFPLEPKNHTAKYEIFRIVNVQNNEIVLDPGKRLKDYFTFPGAGTACVRSILIFEPHVTRLIGLPSGLGFGKEKTFVVVPPERSANSDLMPPYDGTVSWTQGDFDPYDPTLVGHPGFYGEKVKLPIPLVKDQRRGRIQRDAGGNAPIALDAGYMIIEGINHTVSADDVGKILRVYRIIRTGVAPLTDLGGGALDQETVLGWFEVEDIDVLRNEYYVRRVTEIDPTTGRYHFGSPNLLILDNNALAGDFQFDFTVHDAVSDLYSQTHLNLDMVESARLKNLIDPAWIKRTAKNSTVMEGVRPGRPDKAIWDTASGNGGASGTNANPGSLLDLGFRMVLYPAKTGQGAFAGSAVPDFDKPITSREVVLDHTLDEAQYIDIDYASGLVTLSHTPNVTGTRCQVAPNGIVATADNPRGEIILFAACVPYSMEPGQRGVGFRVVASKDTQDAKCADGAHLTDVYSQRTVLPVLYEVEGAPQVITSGTAQILDLATTEGWTTLPDSGFIELRFGSEYGGPLFTGLNSENVALFGYYRKSIVTDVAGGFNHVRLHGVYGGGDSTAPDTYTVTHASDIVAVLRRDVAAPVSFEGVPGTAYEQDTTYGFAKRSTHLHFKDVDVEAQPDGSLKVTPYDASHIDELNGELFRSWLISGGEVSRIVGSLTVDVAAAVTLTGGKRATHRAQQLTLPANATWYVIFNGTDTSCPILTRSASLPLGTRDVLLAKVVTGGAAVTSVTDLRNPLTDIDKRLDILVGKAGSVGTTPHFGTLADAVAYCSEIMDPTNGDNGNYLRIKVVGYTEEDSVTLPIKIKANGLIIEGASVRRDGGATTPNSPTSIQWASDTALLDLNGKSDLVLDNLTFSYKDDSQAALLTPNRVVLTNSGATISGLVVRNCRLFGPGTVRAHGFMYLDVGGITQSVFEGNQVYSNDFGIFVDTGVSFFNVQILNNRFQQTNTANLAADVAALQLASASTRAVKIQGNYVWGFDKGVYIEGGESWITENTIEQTVKDGIHVKTAVACHVSGNVLVNVHTSAAPRKGIYIETGTYSVIEKNRISITGAVDTDSAIDIANNAHAVHIHQNTCNGYTITVGTGEDNHITNNDCTHMTTNDRCLIEGNTFLGTLTAGANCRVANNRVSGGNLVIGNSCAVLGNHVALSDLNVGKYCQVQGNIVAGDLNVSTADPSRAETVVIGNRVAGAITLAENCRCISNTGDVGPTTVVLDKGCTVSGNECILTDSGVSDDEVEIVGNHITNALDLDTANSIIKGNRFQAVNPANNTIRGDGNIVSDNIVVAGLNVQGNDCAIHANKVGDNLTILNDGANGHSVLMGNHVAGDIVASGAGNNKPTGTILVGNKVVGGNIFGGATPVANDNNIS